MIFNKNTPFLFLAVCVAACSAQKPNPDYAGNPQGLIALNESTVDEFDSKMAKNNYHLVRKKDGESFNTYSYEYDNNAKTGVPFYSIVKFVNSGGENKMVMFMKGGNENYTTLKDQLTGMGYKFVGEDRLQGQATFIYAMDAGDQMIKVTPAGTDNKLMTIRVIYLTREPLSLN